VRLRRRYVIIVHVAISFQNMAHQVALANVPTQVIRRSE
jgi:hypothetical protein